MGGIVEEKTMKQKRKHTADNWQLRGGDDGARKEILNHHSKFPELSHLSPLAFICCHPKTKEEEKEKKPKKRVKFQCYELHGHKAVIVLLPGSLYICSDVFQQAEEPPSALSNMVDSTHM